MLEVHNIEEKDIPEITALEKEIFSDAWSAKSIEETFQQKQAMILGAWSDGKLVGYVIFYYVLDQGEIARIAVDSGCRRKGAAGQLILHLEDFCEEKGIHNIMLDVRESNMEAIGFYESNGFTEDGVRKDFYENPKEDAVLMSRELGR